MGSPAFAAVAASALVPVTTRFPGAKHSLFLAMPGPCRRRRRRRAAFDSPGQNSGNVSIFTSITLTAEVPLVAAATAARPLVGDALDAFSAAVRGEWSGFEASFNGQGKPVRVEDYYVPEEFVEWGIWPTGFISTHSVTVRGTTLFHKHFRSLPTVSHFGDMVELEDDVKMYDVSGADAGFMAWTDGSFAAGPAMVVTTRKSILDDWPVAHMVLRHDGKAVHAYLKFDFTRSEFVDNVRIFVEKYSCIYCDGADIEGCSGAVSGFSEEDPMSPEHLAGDWSVVAAPEKTVVSRPSGGPAAEQNKHIYLPQGIDVSVYPDSNSGNGGVALHVGWLVNPATRVVMSRSFNGDGSVRASYRHVETRS
jgi:hypothetical protein